MKTLFHNIAPAPPKSQTTLWRLLQIITRACPLLMLLLISMSWSACRSPRVVVIPADQTETRVKAGQTITPATDSMLIGIELYRRYRQAVADKILEVQSEK